MDRFRPFVLALLPLSWLLSNHYYPWTTAWQEGLALGAVLVAALFLSAPPRLPFHPWTAAILTLVGISVLLQWGSGIISFSGDALMVLLYLMTFAAALILGKSVRATSKDRFGLDLFLVSVALAGAVGVVIAVAQWWQVALPGIHMADLRPGHRPYGNLAQANHFSSASFLALCATGALWQRHRLPFWPALCLLAWFALGIAMSGSRTGILQLAMTFVLLLTTPAHVLPSRKRLQIAFFLAIVIGVYLLWRWHSSIQVRAIATGGGVDVRWPLWHLMFDAILRGPYLGYGWQQISSAQAVTALDHRPLQRHFESAHNLVLDLLLWMGPLLGALLIGFLVKLLLDASRASRSGDRGARWLWCGVLGLLVHSMVEAPLTFAYFLLPFGVLLGALDPDLVEIRKGGPLRLVRLAVGATAFAFACVVLEYLAIEEATRIFRFEAARIGTMEKVEAPKLRLLTQQDALLKFYRTEARAGMPPALLDQMRIVAVRFAYPPVMLRYALAAGLNGKPDEAAETLRRLCAMHHPERCQEARDAWLAAQTKFPVLLLVQPPSVPNRVY